MRFDVFTLFPEVFIPYLSASVIKRAITNNLLDVELHDIRQWTTDKHHITDDAPYGGGGGMVMKPAPVFSSVEDILGAPPTCPVILLSPQGRPFTHLDAQRMAQLSQVGLICGHYEGVDERIREHLVTDEISVGDFVVTGGELPALMVIDACARFIPGVLGDPTGALDDSFASGLLEYPHYTRPVNFRGWEVPEVLRSGNHADIDRWRREQALKRTLQRRPDLLEKMDLDSKDRNFLSQQKKEDSKK